MRITKFLHHLTAERRSRYKLQKQKRLLNTTPTIICNSCIGGTIYRDLNLPFCSPTIDVLINYEDFLRFVNHLEYYITCIPEQIFLDGISYPVGVLYNGNEKVVLEFMHDSSFEAAKNKWVRRCQRVDLNNLYIIFSNSKARLRAKNYWYQEFKKIKHPHKRLIVKICLFFDKEVISCPKFALLGKKKILLDYPTPFSKKRFLDTFDYVSFFNTKHL